MNHSGCTTSTAAVRSVPAGTPARASTGSAAPRIAVEATTGRPKRASRALIHRR